MCKLDLKDAYFCIPLAEESKIFVRFYWEEHLYQFMCLCFRLAPGSYVFTKLKERENDYTVTKDLENINFRTDHNYCGVPTKPTQQSSGLETCRKVDSSE